jgi:hypothetical protein
MGRGRRLIGSGLAAGTLVLGVAVAAGAASTPLVKATSGPLSATLKPSTRTPKINTKWPITVTATLKGMPAHASAAYEFLFAGTPVGGTQYPYNNKRYTFTGHFSDNLVFPRASVGQPLTLDVVIKAAGHTVNLLWSIKSHI